MSVLEAIGNTPLVEIVKINPYRDKVRVLAKLEGANPCGSVKDRPAAKMIEETSALARDGAYEEIVFCGYGEPTCRLADVLEAARALKKLGLPLRLDTNGQGNMINRRDVVPELSGVFDGVSVSLNAHDRSAYVRLCRPDAGEKAFDAVMDFIRRAAASRMECTVTVLDHPDVNVEACRTLVASIPRARFRVRRYYITLDEE